MDQLHQAFAERGRGWNLDPHWIQRLENVVNLIPVRPDNRYQFHVIAASPGVRRASVRHLRTIREGERVADYDQDSYWSFFIRQLALRRVIGQLVKVGCEE